jgi:hypothetical protein
MQQAQALVVTPYHSILLAAVGRLRAVVFAFSAGNRSTCFAATKVPKFRAVEDVLRHN